MRYIGIGICLLLAAAQFKPIYFIVSEFSQNQAGNSTAFLLGKIAGHLFVVILVLLIALKLFKNAKN